MNSLPRALPWAVMSQPFGLEASRRHKSPPVYAVSSNPAPPLAPTCARGCWRSPPPLSFLIARRSWHEPPVALLPESLQGLGLAHDGLRQGFGGARDRQRVGGDGVG